MASLILGITGKKRSGKDTFAARLISHHGFTRVAFADPLKAVARDLDPVVDVDTDYDDIRLTDVLGPGDPDWETAKELPEVRRILQVLGVAVRDHVDPEAWVNAALRRAAEIPGPAVITDVRFPNEAELISRLGGVLVRVTRPGLESTDTHASETALDAWIANCVVRNDGTIDQLHAAADDLILSL